MLYGNFLEPSFLFIKFQQIGRSEKNVYSFCILSRKYQRLIQQTQSISLIIVEKPLKFKCVCEYVEKKLLNN